MFQRGLTDKDRGKLEQAGAAPCLVAAIDAEARTMRWLFMLRFSGTVVLGLISVVAGVFMNVNYDLEGSRATAVTAALAMIFGLGIVLPTLEMRAKRHHEPARWAARRLAVLSVQAHPDHGEAGDEGWRELQRLVSAGQGVDHPHAALRQIAHVLRRPKPKPPRQPRESNDALTLDRGNLQVASYVALALALSALVMMAVLRFS
ncbi:MAG: hypothetical protein RIA71_00805 [Oceanicaulis sp.]